MKLQSEVKQGISSLSALVLGSETELTIIYEVIFCRFVMAGLARFVVH